MLLNKILGSDCQDKINIFHSEKVDFNLSDVYAFSNKDLTSFRTSGGGHFFADS